MSSSPLPQRSAMALDAAQEAIVASVDDYLRWNVSAYGKAWTEEYDDTEFLCNGAAAKGINAYIAARGFIDLVADVQLMLETHYPEDVFGPDPIDSGARFIVKLREALACVHADPPKDSHA